jgi:hypothetical protein
MTFPFSEENNTSRHRLETLMPLLSDDDLVRFTPSGWTVAGLLAHLAFWDQRMVALLERWQADGVDYSPVDSYAVNEALKPLCLALEPRRAVELCLAAAEAVDAELEAISPQFMEQIEASRTHFRFNRALHRNDHLDEIESLVQLDLTPDGE